MRTLKKKIILEDTRQEMETVTEQTKYNSNEMRSQSYLTNLIFDAIR
jgi:hypothetical protein